MTLIGQKDELHVITLDLEGRAYDVTLEVENDGVEHVGHLWFSDVEWDDEGVRDHGTIPGRSAEEVLRTAREISTQELGLRFKRAQVDQRRFHGLRKLTDEVLENIRHLNKVATSMRAGLLEVADAAEEIDATEKKLHEMIDRLRLFAGVTA